MTARKCLTGAFTALLLTASAAASQESVAVGGWRELLESRTRAAYRYTHPEENTTECPAAEMPAVASLVTPEHGQSIGRTWLPGPNQSRWETITGPTRPDTMAVRLVELWCTARGPSILVESDGYYLEIASDQLASVDRNGDIAPGILVMPGSSGEYVQVMFEERCTVAGCTVALEDAQAAAQQIRTALAERQEAQRREWEAAERSLEALRTDRRQTSLDAQVRAEGIARRNLLETLQRYGATDAQARAILERRVLIGMTPAMVRAALGEPEQTTQEVVPQGTMTVWIYPGRRINFLSGLVSELR